MGICAKIQVVDGSNNCFNNSVKFECEICNQVSTLSDAVIMVDELGLDNESQVILQTSLICKSCAKKQNG